MNKAKTKQVQALCKITHTESGYELRMPLTKTTYHKTEQNAIAVRDKVIRQLLWCPKYYSP